MAAAEERREMANALAVSARWLSKGQLHIRASASERRREMADAPPKGCAKAKQRAAR